MKTVRVGAIGCGDHSSKRILPSISEAGLDLVACCDLEEDRAKKMAFRFSGGKYYTDWREMCRRESLDGVIVVIGPREHYRLSLELMKMGFHVWTEKPPAETAVESEEVAAASSQTGKIVQTGFNYRYTIGVRSARLMIQRKIFEEPGMIAVRWWLGEDDPKVYLKHYVCHAVDLLHHLAGALSNMVVRGTQKDGKLYYQALFDAPNGCVAVLELSNTMPIQRPWCRVDLMSPTGILSVVDFYRLELARGGEHRPMDEEHNYDTMEGDQSWNPPYYGGPRMSLESWGYIPELIAFRRAVLGEIPPESTIRDSAFSMRVSEAIILESAIAARS